MDRFVLVETTMDTVGSIGMFLFIEKLEPNLRPGLKLAISKTYTM